MMEVFTMWRNTRMIVLVAVSAAAYAAIILPFKGLVIIPGLTEVRPGAAIPIVMSFLFGPAAAWGAAFGNLIGDVVGSTLSPGSIFGFVGNFLYGYLPYSLWRALMGNASPITSGVKGWIVFALILCVDCMAIGSVIGWGIDVLGLFPFAALGFVIAVNNLIASAAISTIILALLYGRVHSWGLLHYQILEEEPQAFPDDMPGRGAGSATDPGNAPAALAIPVMESKRPFRKIAFAGAILCICGVAIAFFSGLVISGEILHAGYGAVAFASSGKGTTGLALGMAPGLVMMLTGAAML